VAAINRKIKKILKKNSRGEEEEGDRERLGGKQKKK